ncbi:hypothetical protein A6R68_18695, partial [Neotoma lepida]
MHKNFESLYFQGITGLPEYEYEREETRQVYVDLNNNIEVNKLELELEHAKQKFQEMTDNYQKEIEVKKIAEEKLLGEETELSNIKNELVSLKKQLEIEREEKKRAQK